MLGTKKIKKIIGREILDSRGNPTVQVTVVLTNGMRATASVPSGASTGSHEALELRDNDKKRYGGKGVLKAVKHVNTEINTLLHNVDVTKQQDIDRLMIRLDGTHDKSRLGANAILGVSLACARAGAMAMNMPLYAYIRAVYKIQYNSYTMPRPMMNILNGGAHAHFAIDVQECMIVPNFSSMRRMVQAGAEIYHTLGAQLRKKGLFVSMGDEGGYAVAFEQNEEAYAAVLEAISAAGYVHQKNVDLALDVAASEFYKSKKYTLKKPDMSLSSAGMQALLTEWQKRYKLLSIEDGLAEDDWKQWESLTKELGDKCMLVGDDLFVTNTERLEQGIERGVANAILIKLNQIGTLTETISAIYLAKVNNYKVAVSHRSGETADTFIADLAVATNAEFIKTGSLSRSERVEKYNRLMEIEDEVLKK